MSRKFLLIYFFVIILFFGCKAKSISEENSGIFNFIGTWRIESVEKLDDKEDDEEDLAYLIGDEIQLDSNKVNILGIYKQNIHYKLKAVQGDYIISYENSLTMNEFMNGREMVDLISIIDKNQIIGEFFLNSDTEMILLYKSNLIKLRRINKSTNFDDIKNDVIIGNETQEEEFDAKEGIMLGIKTPSKEIDEGIYSDDKYKTLWISHDNWKIGNVYGKPNVIFPRLNGIWKLEVNQKSSNGFERDEFMVGKYDEKLKDNTVGKLNLDKSEYKTIKFVGNDYIAIGKYQGTSFEGNYPIYQIIPVNNINIENGLQIDEIFTGTEKEKYLEEFQRQINSLSKEKLEKLKSMKSNIELYKYLIQ